MKISYDKKADAATIYFQKGRYHRSKEMGDGMIVDYTKNGKIISIEILDVSKRFQKKTLREFASVQSIPA